MILRAQTARQRAVFPAPGWNETKRLGVGDHLQIGTVARWFPEKRYGFIRADGADADLFVHVSQIGPFERLYAGQRVQVATGANGKTGRIEAPSVRLAH